MPINQYVIGLMSGSSMDGLDAAWVHFNGELEIGQLQFEIKAAHTFPFPKALKARLVNAPKASGFELMQLDHDFGTWMAQCLKELKAQYPTLRCDWIGSHGHTVFHQPSLGFSTQIGHPAPIASLLGIPVVYDFRNLDIAYKGQGAPLVPVGDLWLFPQSTIKLNLGGICNISFLEKDQVIAGDLCACNQVLNHLAQRKGKNYDEGGKMAAQGKLIPRVLSDWMSIQFHSYPFPKSLSNEQVRQWYLDPIDSQWNDFNTEDLLVTACRMIAAQIYQAIPDNLRGQPILVSGGGAYNTTLLNLLKDEGLPLLIPKPQIIEYKEALIFALLALLRAHNLPNTLASSTGASHSASCGSIVGGG